MPLVRAGRTLTEMGTCNLRQRQRKRSAAMTAAGRLVARVAVVTLAVSMLFASALGGRAYFFCAAMDRIMGDHPCCAAFEPSVEEAARASMSGDPMTIDEDDACCEARTRPVLPSATAFDAPAPLEAPWVGLVPTPSALASLTMPARAPTFRAERATGPPPQSARERAARLSVFIL